MYLFIYLNIKKNSESIASVSYLYITLFTSQLFFNLNIQKLYKLSIHSHEQRSLNDPHCLNNGSTRLKLNSLNLNTFNCQQIKKKLERIKKKNITGWPQSNDFKIP